MRIPSHNSAKKEGEDVFIVRLQSPVSWNNKDIHHFLWNSSNSLSNTDSVGESEKTANSLHETYKKKIVEINKSIFQTVRNQKSFLRCYKGTQEGALYPMKCKSHEGLILNVLTIFVNS
jgi:hypothetical protein